jgi:hypothetical protein
MSKTMGKSDMDMVLMLFGMDYPISIGKVDKKGQFTANLENVSLDKYLKKTYPCLVETCIFNFYFNCNNRGFWRKCRKIGCKAGFCKIDQEWRMGRNGLFAF